MKFMEKLLVGEKVEWKKLGEVCEILDNKRKPIAKKDRIIGTYPYYGANGIQSFVNNYIFDGSFILMGEDGSVINKDKSPVLHWINNKKIWVNNHAHVLGQLNIRYNLKYIYYYLSIVDVSSIVKGTPPKINQANMKEIKIPIPSLEIQEKIVKILDNFTKCVTELQAELQARNKQYNYYRDMLLSEDYLNKISKKIYEIEENRTLALVPIKEVCIRQRGFSITAGEMKEIHKDNAPIKIFAGGKTTANIDEYNIDKKYIIKKPSIIVKSRGNIDFEFYDKPFSHKNELWSYSSNDDNILNIKYLYYYLKKNIKYFEDKAISGKLPQISTGITDNYKIWLPSIIIQNKIVKILDRFQELLSDTKGLLPLEIEQRRKQYEYYREKLLTFDKEEGYALSTAQHSTAQRQITSEFFELLKEAAKIAGVDVSDKVEWKTLNEIFNTRTGYTPSRKKMSYWENGVINWFTIEDIRQRGRSLDFANVKISESGVKKEVFKSNSMVLSIIGTIGEYALIKTDFVINQQFMVFTLKDNYLD